MITDFLISVVDLKISILKNIRRHLTGEDKMDKTIKDREKMLKNGQNKIIKMKKWILDNLPTIWIIAILIFGIVMCLNQVGYEKELEQIYEKINRV